MHHTPHALFDLPMTFSVEDGIPKICCSDGNRFFFVGRSPATVCAWLVINSMRAENLQLNLLCEQSLHNLWRKKAFRFVVENCRQLDAADVGPAMGKCIEIFRERVHHGVENMAGRTLHWAVVVGEGLPWRWNCGKGQLWPAAAATTDQFWVLAAAGRNQFPPPASTSSHDNPPTHHWGVTV